MTLEEIANTLLKCEGALYKIKTAGAKINDEDLYHLERIYEIAQTLLEMIDPEIFFTEQETEKT